MNYLRALYLLTLLGAFVCGWYRYRILDTASKWMCVLIGLTFACEILAYIAILKYNNNRQLYAVFSIIELLFLCIYFNYAIDVFRKRNIGIYIGLACVTAGTLNAVFFQSINIVDTYFLFFDGICVVGMSLFAFFRLLLTQDRLELLRYPHFWIMSAWVFFWCCTFFYWGLYDYAILFHKDKVVLLHECLIVVNTIAYFVIGVVFFRFPKLQLYQDE